MAAQYDQLLWQGRRDSYSGFLVAFYENREELFSLWHNLKDHCGSPALRDVGEFESARARIYAPQHAGAVVTVHGPESVAHAANRALREVEAFYSELRTLRHTAEGETPDTLVTTDVFRQCSKQRVDVLRALDEFSACARLALSVGSDSHASPIQPAAAEPAEQSDLSWLVAQTAELMGLPSGDVDPRLGLFDLGFESLTVVGLRARMQGRYTINAAELFEYGQSSIYELAGALASHRELLPIQPAIVGPPAVASVTA